MDWWVYNLYANGQTTLLISWIFWVLLSITLHELAHGWAAIWQGDDTPIRLQRMTLNPVVHMGGVSLLMFAVFGLAWGLMPVNPSRFRWGRYGDVFVSAAGPAMNLLLAFLALTGDALWIAYGPQSNDRLFDNIQIFLFAGGWLNIALAFLNLLPIPPLDGATVLSGFSAPLHRWYQTPQAQQIGLFIFLAIFLSGLGDFLDIVATNISDAYLDALLSILPGSPSP